jgi:hypothetical protein
MPHKSKPALLANTPDPPGLPLQAASAKPDTAKAKIDKLRMTDSHNPLPEITQIDSTGLILR